MKNKIRASLVLGAAGICYYDHQNYFHYLLGKQQMLERPNFQNHPPAFNVDIDPNFEQKFDSEMKDYSEIVQGFEKKYIEDGKTFRGHTMQTTFDESIPNSIGLLEEKEEGRIILGNFIKGNLEGYAQIKSEFNDGEKVEKYQFNNGVRSGYFVTDEKIKRQSKHCEGTQHCYKCKHADGSTIYEQISQGELKSYTYDGQGGLRQYKEINAQSQKGKGEHYYEDGRFYEGELFEGMPHGQGKMIDRYGDTMYEGEFIFGSYSIIKSSVFRFSGLVFCLIFSFMV